MDVLVSLDTSLLNYLEFAVLLSSLLCDTLKMHER